MSYLLECRLPAWRLLKELPSIKVRAVPSRLPSRCRGPEPLLFLGLSPIHVLVGSAFRQIHFLSDCKPICTCVRGSSMHSGQKSISERAESQGCVIPGISRTSRCHSTDIRRSSIHTRSGPTLESLPCIIGDYRAPAPVSIGCGVFHVHLQFSGQQVL